MFSPNLFFKESSTAFLFRIAASSSAATNGATPAGTSLDSDTPKSLTGSVQATCSASLLITVKISSSKFTGISTVELRVIDLKEANLTFKGRNHRWVQS